MRQLPSLNLFRGFQVIGKHLNLAVAAREAHLTSSALSHQLNALENALGIKLFSRTGRGLVFTKAGRELHAEVDACLTRLGQAVRNATSGDKEGVLVVNVMPTFAMHWLLPRFARFGHSNTEIRVSTVPIDFERDDIDCAIYYGPGDTDERLVFEFLKEVRLIVVCAPSAIPDDRPLARPADLAHHQLLRAKLSTRMAEDWGTWFESAGMERPRQSRELVVENRNLVIQAAQSGLGIAVVDPLMVQEELRSGKLIQPLAHTARANGSYYLVYPRMDPPPERVLAFRDWLLAELQNDPGPAASPD